MACAIRVEWLLRCFARLWSALRGPDRDSLESSKQALDTVGEDVGSQGDRNTLHEKRTLCEDAATLLVDGWWLGTNYSNASKEKMLEDVQSVARRLGVEFEFSLGDTA